MIESCRSFKNEKAVIKVDIKYKNIEQATIKDLVHQAVLGTTELEFLKLFIEYDVIDRVNLREAFNYSCNEEVPLDDKRMIKIMRKLNKLSMINRFYIVPESGKEAEVYFYRLTEGAYKYVLKHFKINKTKKYEGMIYSVDKVFELLSYNQAIIAMKKTYGDNFYRNKVDEKYIKLLNKGKFRTKGIYSVSINGERRRIIFDTVRRSEGWKETFKEHTFFYTNAISKLFRRDGIKGYVVFICEDNSQYEQCALAIKDKKLKFENVLYTSDGMCFMGDPLDELHRVVQGESGTNISFIHQKLDFKK